MKKLILSLVAIATISLSSYGQAPEGFKYQAVVRDAGNLILNNQAVGMRMTIQQDSIGGSTVYQETFTPTTNGYGLVNLEIGSGTVVSGDFTTIDWANGPYFIETAVDVTGGTSYAVMGTSQLMSVPYALHANTAENVINELDSSAIANMGFVASSGTCGLSIGDTYQGGIIFYLDTSGCHGLVCAPIDQSAGIQWYNGSYSNTGTTGDGLYAGAMNTTMIVATQMADNQTGNFAAKVCADYSLTVGGVTYGDWYLPSRYELNLMWLNLADSDGNGINNGPSDPGNLGGFVNSWYWSSAEDIISYAWEQSFTYGNQNPSLKYLTLYVRAVRSF